jgi:thymidylate kinase
VEVVEFLGPPGSGKTTVWRELLGSLDEAGVSVVDLDEATLTAIRLHGADGISRTLARLVRSAASANWRRAYARSTDRFTALSRFLLAHPAAMEAILTAQRRRRERDLDQERVLNWLMDLMVITQLADESAERYDWLLVDEGFCQRAIALFGAGFEDEDQDLLRSYMASIPLPDVLVVVEAPADVCEARLDEGGAWSERLDRMSGAERRAFLDTTFRLVELVAGEAQRHGARVVRVDGTAPVAETRDVLARDLVP